MISKERIDEVKKRAEIVDVIGRHITLKKDGINHTAKCPFHNERTPSFKVSHEKQIFKCFGCGKGGSAVDFIMMHKDLRYIDAIKYLADIYKVELGEEVIKHRPVYSNKALKQSHTDWFASRGISTDTIERARITYSTEWMPKAGAETDVICFNYFRKGELINVKYRGENKDFKLAKGAELIFYNLDSIKNNEILFITEGEMDCLSIMECGYRNVISVPNGASAGKQKLEYFDNCYDELANIEKFILLTDNDDAGNNLRDELSRRIGKERCHTVKYPDDCKDANDVLVKHGRESLIDVLKSAQPYPIEGIITVADMMEDLSDYYLNGYPKGIDVGMEGLGEYLTFMSGQITTITGIPGSGKSEVTDNIMAKASINHGWTWAVCSFENQPSSLHASKLMEKIIGKSFAPRINPDERINQEEFHIAAQYLDAYFNFININQVDVTLDGILAKAKELVHRKGINGLLIDPWNYIEHKIPTGQTETQYVSECLTKLKAFALTNDIHIILIAHPTKLKKENNRYEVPTMYHISGSAHFFNKTDNGLSIYRNFDTNEVDIHVQKVRYSWLGKIGMISYNYNTYTRQYMLIDK